LDGGDCGYCEFLLVEVCWIRDATGDELVRMRYCFDVQKGIKRMG
jgi:hypothetical protein